MNEEMNYKQKTILFIVGMIWISLIIIFVSVRNMSFRIEMDNNTKEAVLGLNNTLEGMYSLTSNNFDCDKNLSLCEYALSDCQWEEEHKIKSYEECLWIDEYNVAIYCYVEEGEVECLISTIGTTDYCREIEG